MHTQTSNFKQEADKIRVQPPRSAWKRIEAQLDADSSRRKFRIAHLINYAAAAVLIAILASIGLYFSNYNSWDSTNLYSHSLESLSMEPSSGASIYDIEKVKDLTVYFVTE